MKKLLIIISFLLTAVGSRAQVHVEASIDSIAILIGQQAKLTLSVTAKEGDKIAFQPFKASHYLVPGIEVLRVSKADTTALDNSMVKVSKTLTVTAFDEKLYPISGLWVNVNGKRYTSNNLALKVITVDVDTLHLDKFYPPKDVQDNPFLWSDWKAIFWLSVLAVLLCLIGLYLYARLKQNKPIVAIVRVVKRVPAHQRALSEIDEMKREKLATSDNQKAYYTKLTDTLRRYIEERFGFNAMEMTSAEIIEHLQQQGDKTMIDELKELFETADLVKFAKYSTLMNENDLNLVNAIHFIDHTKSVDKSQEERIVPQLSDDDKRSRQQRTLIQVLLGAVAVVVVLLFVYIAYHLLQLL